jgi:hypothetical protein
MNDELLTPPPTPRRSLFGSPAPRGFHVIPSYHHPSLPLFIFNKPMDGASGIWTMPVMQIKAFAYVARMTNDTK